MQRSAKKPPMGSTWGTSYWGLFLLAAADVPLIAGNKFLGRSHQMWCIAKEDPLGIVQVVQPEGSYFLRWDKDVAPYHKKRSRSGPSYSGNGFGV